MSISKFDLPEKYSDKNLASSRARSAKHREVSKTYASPSSTPRSGKYREVNEFEVDAEVEVASLLVSSILKYWQNIAEIFDIYFE